MKNFLIKLVVSEWLDLPLALGAAFLIWHFGNWKILVGGFLFIWANNRQIARRHVEEVQALMGGQDFVDNIIKDNLR